MVADETSGVAVRFCVQQIVDVALTVQRYGLGPMLRHGHKPHLAKQIVQNSRFRVRELNEFKSISAGRVCLRDRGFRGVMRERSHGLALL